MRLWLPGWLRSYRRAYLPGDLGAGLVVTLLLAPQGLAYALVAGLPAQAGLYASIAPLLIYALAGRSHAQSVGPMAMTSLLVAATLARLAEPGSGDYLALAIGLALLSGAMLAALGLLRLGFIADLLSEPVLAAFTSASALLIVLSQLGPLLGVQAGGASLPQLLAGLWKAADGLNPLALMFGATALAMLLLARWLGEPFLRRCGLSGPTRQLWLRLAPLLAVLLGMALVAGLGLRSVLPVVGGIPPGLPAPTWPGLSLDQWSQLALPAFFIALINYVQSLAVAQALAQRRGDEVDPDRELLALGLCNIGAGLSGGFPVTGGLTRSMVNAEAGAQTQLASVVAALGIMLLASFAAGALALLPLAVLAAMIIASVSVMIRFDSLRLAWRVDRADAAAFALTFVLVLWLGVDSGIVAGVLMSLAAMLWRSSRPHIAELGRLPGSHHFRNRLRFAVESLPGALFLRVDESLFFGNARQVRGEALRRLAAQVGTTRLVLIMSAVNRVDTSALLMLARLDAELAARGVTLHLAEIKGPVAQRMEGGGLLTGFAGRVHLSAQAAWEALAAARRGGGEAHTL
ncbi:SulP family inorganic anion transporter [Chromobacterium haemolyticum]|uniref:SulP family inorganic anion transporter n=1 Tax=Chromobacterium fluminis TaxID=3044269 RepID=A0ABX0L429_9NEIS|nr:SulP family inorganic anion transporter [Chromobacterium haemolyticum]NHR03748.1 SulP family inorganic anion transporter [Chromobacterium haemolyticum]